MRSSHRSQRYRPAVRSTLGLEQLEHRALLTVATGDVQPQPLVPADTLSPATDAGEAGADPDSLLVQSVVLTPAPDPTPWLTYAQQSQIGSTVLRILLTSGSSPGADPTPSVRPLQTTFNAGMQGARSPSSTGPTTAVVTSDVGGVPGSTTVATGSSSAAAEPKVTGVVFPGQGVPVLATDPWPKSIETLDVEQLPKGPGPQEYFVVLQSDSNLVLALTSFVAALMSDPAFAQGGTSSGGAGASGLGGLFGPLFGNADTAGSGTSTNDGTTGSGEPAAGLAALLIVAALAGLGGIPSGPVVGLASDTGVSNTDNITSDGRLDVTADPGMRLQYSRDGGRHWTSTFSAREGSNTVQVRQVDGSGTASAATSFTFTLDRRRPEPPRVSLVGGAGGVQPAQASGVPAFAFKKQESLAAMQYSVNGGGWTSALSPVPGRNVVRVRQLDLAGNISRPSKAVVFTVAGDSPVAAASLPEPVGGGQASRPSVTEPPRLARMDASVRSGEGNRVLYQSAFAGPVRTTAPPQASTRPGARLRPATTTGRVAAAAAFATLPYTGGVTRSATHRSQAH